MSAPSRAIKRITAATQELWQIAEAGDVSRLDLVLQRGAEMNATNANGVTALMRAAAAGNEEFVRKLVERGADINAHRDDGFNPLLLATFFGRLDTVRALVEMGADLSSTTRCGNTAEQWARSRAFDEIAVFLQEARQKPRTPTINYFKPTVERQPNPPKPVVVEGVFREQSKPLIHSSLEEEVEYVADDQVEFEVEPILTRPPEIRTLKDPPEIWDLVHPAAPQFHPGSAFARRLTSTWTSRILFGIFLCLVVGGSVYGFLKYRGRFKPGFLPTIQSAQTGAPASATNPSAVTGGPQTNGATVSTTTDGQSVETGTPTVDGAIPAASFSSNTRFVRKRKKVAVSNENAPVNDEAATKPQAAPSTETLSPSSADQNKKKADTGLSPQLIAPAKTSPTPKPKVIQWP